MHKNGNGDAPRYRALASDGDGTLTKNKKMSDATAAALERWRAAGGKVVLTTGEDPRQLDDFPNLHLFDLVVGENGGILYAPATKETAPLAGPPPDGLVEALKERGVDPLNVGRVIVSTKRPHDRAAREVIARLALNFQVIFNRHEVMLVPPGIDKSTGLARALAGLGLSPHEVVGIGDGENDVPLLRFCGLGAATANAVPELKNQADLVTKGGAGDGVAELIERMLAGDLPARGRRKQGASRQGKG